jgi:signal transduction histidine kinase
MQNTKDNIAWLVITVMMGMVIIVSGFILLLLRNQQKLTAEKNKRLEEQIYHNMQLLRSVIESQEAERTRIGRDLHDSVGGALNGLRLSIDRIVKEQQSVDYKSQINGIISSVRTISHNLSPEILTIQSLSDAIEEFCYNLDTHSGLSVFFTLEGENTLDTLNLTASTAIYRILEELIANTIKHANATHVDVTIIAEEDLLLIDYQDNGSAMSASNENKKGRGLQNIESRLQIMRGVCTTSVNPGYHMKIYIPVADNKF